MARDRSPRGIQRSDFAKCTLKIKFANSKKKQKKMEENTQPGGPMCVPFDENTHMKGKTSNMSAAGDDSYIQCVFRFQKEAQKQRNSHAENAVREPEKTAPT
jgi:hypothetical protein